MSNLIPISDVRANLPNLVNRVNKNLDRVVITVNGQPKAILVSAEELESLEETAEILAIPGARQNIQRGFEQIEKGQVVHFEKVIGQSAKDILNREKSV